MLEITLNKIAEKILHLDEASLVSLLGKDKDKMEHFDTEREWEKSVIIFFIINAVRVKNHIFNEQIIKIRGKETTPPKSTKGKPHLRLVK